MDTRKLFGIVATAALGYFGYLLLFQGTGSTIMAPSPVDPSPAPGAPNDPTLPRGIRNNNPLNIVYSPANNWHGQVGSDGTFAKFDTPVNGLRAAFLLFNTHYNRGMNTLATFIPGWSATDQATYTATVAATLGIDPSTVFDLTALAIPLARAMNGVENGLAYIDYYDVSVYQEAAQLAGL